MCIHKEELSELDVHNRKSSILCPNLFYSDFKKDFSRNFQLHRRDPNSESEKEDISSRTYWNLRMIKATVTTLVTKNEIAVIRDQANELLELQASCRSSSRAACRITFDSNRPLPDIKIILSIFVFSKLWMKRSNLRTKETHHMDQPH